MQAALLTGIEQAGIGGLPWTQELRQRQARVILMRQYQVASPVPWPDLSDEALERTLEAWAVAVDRGFHAARTFCTAGLEQCAARLSHSRAREHPGTRSADTFYRSQRFAHPINYLDGDSPTVSVRLQELFGLSETPAVAGGKLPLSSSCFPRLDAPSRSPRIWSVFWRHGYHEVKKDLKGRYPKHYWPNDPYTAQATRRARPR